MTFKEAKAKVIEILRQSDVYVPRRPRRMHCRAFGRDFVCQDMDYANRLRPYKKIHDSINKLTRVWMASEALKD